MPNPFPDEYGVASRRGVISYRVPQAMYQARRISTLLRDIRQPKVLEIGGGLGRTAFYARKLGIHDYTIVDIPVSAMAQGYFLGRTLGAESVALAGEGDEARRIKIMPPSYFLDSDRQYDLVVNVDSLTEIGRAAADEYWSAIQQRARLSIDQSRSQ